MILCILQNLSGTGNTRVNTPGIQKVYTTEHNLDLIHHVVMLLFVTGGPQEYEKKSKFIRCWTEFFIHIGLK